MGFSEALSDTGSSRAGATPGSEARSPAAARSSGRVPHLPFLINSYHVAILVGIITVTVELVVLAVIRALLPHRFLRSFATVTLGGAIIVAVSAALGSAA